MNQEDVKNLLGWLQAIHKESQETRGSVNELRKNTDMIPEIRTCSLKGTQDSSDAERKIDETRNQLDGKIRHIEDTLNDIRGMLKNLENKVDRLK